MREYSLRPEKDYKNFTDYEVNRDGDTTTWNLIWLACPKVDLMLDGSTAYFDKATYEPWLEGSLFVLAKYGWGSNGKTVPEIMGDSPIRFVDEFVANFTLPAKPTKWPEFSWDHICETMRERAYLSEGLSAQYDAAKESANVILADFTLKKRVS